MRLAVAYSPTRMVQSPSHRETGEKDVGVILFGDDLSKATHIRAADCMFLE
jgi:hypothetical protein